MLNYHPIKKYLENKSISDLIFNLNKEIDKGTVKKQVVGNLTQFSYKKGLDKSDFNPTLILSRGLILDEQKQEIVALPLPKFFNVGELKEGGHDSLLSFLDYQNKGNLHQVTEKVDSSLGIVYFYNDKWNVSTKGSIENSEQAKKGTSILAKYKLEYLNPAYTYLFEIVYPENKIVVPYNEEKLVLLRAYNNKTYEDKIDELVLLSELTGFELPKVYEPNFDVLVKSTKSLPYTQEGYVLEYQNGLLEKLKGDEYCRIHRMLSRVTPLFVWEDMRDMSNVNNLNLLPEEFQLDHLNIKQLLSDKFDYYVGQLYLLHMDTKHLTDKELGLKLKVVKSPVKKFLFKYRQNPNIFFKPSITRDFFFNLFKPKSNKLDGYTPTNAMNRFSNNT